jgi:outer membrane lipoprotein LolB
MMLRWALLVYLTLTLLGCATPVPLDPGSQHWSGRLAVRIQGPAPQAFSTGFELSGTPAAGELLLMSPIGTTVAVVSWQPGKATMQRGSDWSEATSLDDLVVQLLGTSLPVPALFDWLNGRPTQVQGWTADTSEIGNGRLQAQRHSPAPAAEMRLILSQ